MLFAAVMVFCAGCSIPSFLVQPVSSSTELKEEVVEKGKGPGMVVILEVEGMLLNARTGGILQPKENDVSLFTQQLAKAAEDSEVKAIVLRVNSPGGTVAASDAMYEQLVRFRKKTGKPVVASAQDIMASGAYYVSCGADKIVAQRTSVVGSIGVIFESFDFSGSMEKIGAKSTAIKSGEMKDMGSPFKPLLPREKVLMQEMVNDFFARFEQVVSTGRGLEGERLLAVSDGRVFTGIDAVQKGLADQNGTLEDAIELARQLGKAPGASVVLYKRPYGYGGSIYAASSADPPRANVLQLNVGPAEAFLPTGFYYLWQPLVP
jgi:protease-4